MRREGKLARQLEASERKVSALRSDWAKQVQGLNMDYGTLNNNYLKSLKLRDSHRDRADRAEKKAEQLVVELRAMLEETKFYERVLAGINSTILVPMVRLVLHQTFQERAQDGDSD